MRFAQRLLQWAGWTAIVATIVALLTQFIGTPNKYVSALQALTPHAVVVMFFVAIAAFGFGKNRLGVGASVVLFWGLAFMWPLIFAPSGPAAAPNSPTFTVAGSNLLFTNHDIGPALADIAAHDPDIVGFVEVTDRIGAAIDADPLAAEYPYRISYPGGDPGEGRVIWSKYPITPDADDEALKFFITAIVESPSGPVRVILVHTPAPVYNCDGWKRELARIPSIVATSDLPTVLMGDFNGSFLHPPYRNMLHTSGLLDALPAVGKEFSMTWPMDQPTGPFVTLDHVLVNDQLAVVDAEAFDVTGSDHRSVIATIAPVS